MSQELNTEAGMMMGADRWIELNTNSDFSNPEVLEKIAPFPPVHLMQNVSGLTSQADFAAHGAVFYAALQKESPIDLSLYKSILDFGCGCGRLARFFKGHPGHIVGCDVDSSHVDWINKNLTYMEAKLTKPNQALPFKKGEFDCVISISVFTHMDEKSQFYYLEQLYRCTKPGSYLFLTIHGERSMSRAQNETSIFKMLEIPADRLQAASASMAKGSHCFIRQEGHLTSDEYNYGITFIPHIYIKREWSKYFEIIDIASGAIHDFQDIVVCRRN